MADSVSTEAWLDQRRWAALEEALKAQGSNVKRHLQDYLITLYNETVPLERWVQIETAITKEELESAQAAEDQKVYAAFHIREHGHDSVFSTCNGEEFLDVAIRLRRYLQGDAEAVKGGFSHHFYKTQPITRERFDELAALRLENTGKVSGAFEIDLDAGWCSALNLADGWQTFKNKDVSTAAYHANRTRNLQRNEQWRRLVDYLYGRNIELQTFGSIETRGIRPLREGDLTFSEEIILSGHRLGKLLLQGEDAPKDVKAAIRWLTAAAEQGNQYAQYALGKLYLLGKEVPKDRSSAIKWFQLAADQGNEYAQYFLKHMDDRLGQPPVAAVISLFHHLANIFQEQNQPPPSGGVRVAVDRKLLRKIKAKKIAQGHKADDHEPEMQL